MSIIKAVDNCPKCGQRLWREADHKTGKVRIICFLCGYEKPREGEK